MSDSPWRLGRKFMIVERCVYSDDGRRYDLGVLYEVGRFGMIRRLSPGGRSSWWQSTEGERHRLLQYIQWEGDKPSKISNGLRRFIERNPTSKFVRGLVRQEVGIVPASDKTPTTYEGWIDYINSVEVVKPKGLQAEVVEERTVPIDVEGHERVSGFINFSREDSWSGTIQIPLSIIEEGDEDGISDFILENYQDYLEREEGAMDYGDEDIRDGSGLEIGRTNIEQVMQARRDGALTPATERREEP